MRSSMYVSPDDVPPRGGGGPDVDQGFPAQTFRSHGLLTLAFGFSLGLTFMIFFGLFRIFGSPIAALTAFVAEMNNLWLSFLYGFIGGILIAVIYNVLIVRRIKLFGFQRNLD